MCNCFHTHTFLTGNGKESHQQPQPGRKHSGCGFASMSAGHHNLAKHSWLYPYLTAATIACVRGRKQPISALGVLLDASVNFRSTPTLSHRSAHVEKHPLNTFKLGVGVSKQSMKVVVPSCRGWWLPVQCRSQQRCQ